MQSGPMSAEVRKVLKKLRQIAGLEVQNRELSSEERAKLSRKAELRARLIELTTSTPQLETQGFVGNKTEERDKERDQERGRENAKRPGRNQGLRVSGLPDGVPVKQSRLEQAGSTDVTTATAKATQAPTTDFGFQSLRESWEKAKFRLRSLEGHSDIITCVVVIDNCVVSGSRDTTVKVWHVPTATEERNLGGHTGGVTCLAIPPPEHCSTLALCLGLSPSERFILSGSVDSCVRVWVLSSGQCVRSIYTFSGVSSLAFIPEREGFIVTGSEGGKVEVWSWLSGENCQSVRAHEDKVTDLKAHGPLLFSGSLDGGLSVWEMTTQSGASGSEVSPPPLRHLTHRSPGQSGLAAVSQLSPRGERVYVADSRASLREMDWRKGFVSGLANHSTVAGVTDCVTQTEGVLISSGFDLETGEASLNLRSLPENRYLASLSWPGAPRILCLATWLTPSGGHRWVTGGQGLTVWEQLPANNKQRSDVTVKRVRRLDGPALESGSEGETEEEEEEEEEESEEDSSSHNAAEEAEGAGTSWVRCTLL
ncbi:uncharacterized protein LOC136755467 [Amia ocellicauda]|uniref:uncharacterized protein LOC136755467 n=1 Tax=Amia ocellicauda TaxID=2972642 RepID=UPI00346446F9